MDNILKMRYSTEPRSRKYVKGYGFLSFARKYTNKYGKKLMDSASKTGMDASKTAFKRVVQKTAQAAGDLIGNKIVDKITSIGKPKEKKKKKQKKWRKFTSHQKKDNKLLMILDCFRCNLFLCIRMEFQKIVNFLDTTSDDNDLPKFVTKNGLKFMINQKEIRMLTKKLELNHQC